MFKQDRVMPNSMYFEKYQNLLEVLKNQGVDLRCEADFVKSKLNTLDPIVHEIDDATWKELFEAR